MPQPLFADPSLTAGVDVARALGADVGRGLTSAEAARRLLAQGRNVLQGTPPRPAWRRWLAHFQDPLVYLLVAAIAVSAGAWFLEGRVGWPVDALVIALVVLLNGAIGIGQEAKASDAVAALGRLTEASSQVLRDGQPMKVPSADLVCGDLLLLAEGDAVGADARLVEVASLHLQEASLTGESQAVLKDAATLAAAVPPGDRLNMVFKGTAVVQGSGRAVVTATAMATEMGSIATLLEGVVDRPTPLTAEVARIGRMLGAAVLLIAVLVMGTLFALSDIRGAGDVTRVLLLGVSLAVAAVPEGLPAILSVVLALGMQRLARRHAVVKDLSSVETLGSASVICADKTGTLTRSEMTIERVMTLSGGTRVTGVGYAPVGQVEHGGARLVTGPLHAEQAVVLGGGSLAGNASLRQAAGGAWEIHGDPTEAAFLVAERKLGTDGGRRDRFDRIAQVAFTSERKRMSTVERDHSHGDAAVLVCKGAADMLLPRCSRARVGMEVVPLDDGLRQRIRADVDMLGDAALRTLAVAYRPLDDGEDPQAGEALETDMIFVGSVGILDPPRPEAALAIRQARGAGIRVIMITGDHPNTARRVAADLGLADAGAVALVGADIDKLDEPAFRDAVRATSVFARVTPAHKLRIVAALQADGQVVAMTGDGVNDAPALRAADIGVAMGITGTDVARTAARMILADDNFATIVQAVQEGRAIVDNIRKFLRYLLSSNMGEVLTIFGGVAGAGLLGLTGRDPAAAHAVVLPLLATQILWVNLVTDSGPALAMGVDPASADVMSRPPRRPGEHLIDARMWTDVVLTGLVMALATLLTIDLLLPGGLVEGGHTLDQARTAGFTVLVLAQLFNGFCARSDHASAMTQLFANPWLWASVGLAVALQVAVVHLPVLNLAFATVPLTPGQWALCAGMASTVLWASELRKWLRRRRDNA
ncbi:MAG: cation-translocating P-type ATPase [Aquabacterium sp.]